MILTFILAKKLIKMASSASFFVFFQSEILYEQDCVNEWNHFPLSYKISRIIHKLIGLNLYYLSSRFNSQQFYVFGFMLSMNSEVVNIYF